MMTIDELLSQPLAPVADNGFSVRVMARIKAEERRRFVWAAAGSAVAATVACFLVPMPALTHALNTVVLTLGTSVPVGIAAAALLATHFLDRKYLPF